MSLPSAELHFTQKINARFLKIVIFPKLLKNKVHRFSICNISNEISRETKYYLEVLHISMQYFNDVSVKDFHYFLNVFESIAVKKSKRFVFIFVSLWCCIQLNSEEQKSNTECLN